MALERLILKELSEGQTESQVADAIGIPVGTLRGILDGRLPDDRDTWDKLTAYFKMREDTLRFGELLQWPSVSPFLPPHPNHEVVGWRHVPLLSWSQLLDNKGSDGSEEMIETDVAGDNVFAIHVPDDSMEPLFHVDKIIFVQPGAQWNADEYVLVKRAHPRQVLIRQIKALGTQTVLHALRHTYVDVPFTQDDTVLGKVARVRVDL
ncbi:MAG TPA: S24 family peptidase [Nitrospiraceae bacterium]|nr:S24 family peptidase [Nitrospiraceae bacterium]